MYGSQVRTMVTQYEKEILGDKKSTSPSYADEIAK